MLLPKHRPPTHPGAMLWEEYLRPMGITQAALARHLGWSQARVNELVRGKRGVSPEAALALSDALGTSPELWLNLQCNHELWHARQKHRPKARLRAAV